MLPYLRSPHRWISEGFAQYYQNVLLARAGQYDERRAWQKLYEGFERGRKSRPELSPNEAARRGVGAATMKIYWSGAIIALMADVELRRRSDGGESLDKALEQLQRCCLPAARSWSGTQLFERLDSFVEEPIFMPLYRRYANEVGFPEYRAVLEELGVNIDKDRVSLSNDADLAEIRRAITEIY
jgi:predicted metalloprotease with PDZ domain